MEEEREESFDDNEVEDENGVDRRRDDLPAF